MLNEGTRTTALDLVSLVGDPRASDADIVSAMRLPRDLSLEALLMDELRALTSYHDAWTAVSGLDTRELWLRNSACKRVLYLSAPIFLPDTMGVEEFVASGVNERIHVYPAADLRDTIRLEAISSYNVEGFRFRYALSIQYARDSVGLGWQVIRPVIAVDSGVLAAARGRGDAGVAALERLLGALRRLVLVGSHDYVHATVLNWFPPPKKLPPEYAAMLTERVHPPELDRWHAGALGKLPDGLAEGRSTPGIATLELYSLLVHDQVITRMRDSDPRVRPHVLGLVSRFEEALTALLAEDLLGDEANRKLANYFTILAGWFLVSALPLGTQRLSEALALLPGERVDRTVEHLAAVHEGMFDFVRFADAQRFPWSGRFVPVHRVTAEYEQALRWPALREHLRYLLLPTGDGPADSSWARTLCAALSEAERTELLAALSELRAGGERAEWELGLRRLEESGKLDALRGISRSEGSANQRGVEPASTAYARAILASFVRVVDELRTSRVALPV
jgi:hypothetical protein